jgi:hypothetical protein
MTVAPALRDWGAGVAAVAVVLESTDFRAHPGVLPLPDRQISKTGQASPFLS